MRHATRSMSILVVSFVVLALSGSGSAHAASGKTTSKFEGVKANTGTATFTKEGGRRLLTLSDDFQVPGTPDPHWQVVDSHGNTYLLKRLPIKGDKVNRSIELPAYVPDVAKVQIWCAFAETLLGEASFATPAK